MAARSAAGALTRGARAGAAAMRRSLGRAVWLAGLQIGLAGTTLANPAAEPPSPAASAQDWPAQRSVAGQTLVLNGSGLRSYGLFGIEVYRAALYLPQTERDENAVLDASTPRLLEMHFVREVSRDDSVKAWRHYLAANCPPPCVLAPASEARFLAWVPDCKKGDRQTYLFTARGVELSVNGQRNGEVPDPAFARVLLATWIGAAPTTPELKRRLLGYKQR